ncbi:MAG: IclR family transcriptional regulator [Desulfobaccales bacterium]
MRNFADLDKPRYFIRSLAKGLDLLRVLAAKGAPLTLSEIAEAMQMNNMAITRLCYTLGELKFIKRDRHKRFHLTPKILTLGYPVICGLDWREVAKHHLEILFKKVRCTVSLAVLDGSEIMYLLRIQESQSQLPFDIRIGSKLAVYCTSMGKVLMAMGPPEVTRPILANLQFKALTQRTIIQRKDFLKELEVVRMKGYALNDEELSVGLSTVAAPVLNQQGSAVAAICISAPTSRHSCQEMEANMIEDLIRTGQEISKTLLEMESSFVS